MRGLPVACAADAKRGNDLGAGLALTKHIYYCPLARGKAVVVYCHTGKIDPRFD